MQTMYQVDTGYACGGVVVENGIVTETAPIFKWMKGKKWNDVKSWKKIQAVNTVMDNSKLVE